MQGFAKGLGADGFVRTTNSLTVTEKLRLPSGIEIQLGDGAQFSPHYETADANAAYLAFDMQSPDSVMVPIVGFGVGLDGVDLGMFNGLAQPGIMAIDADRDSYAGVTFSGDDVAILKMRLGTAGTVRNHTIPDVASSTLAVIGVAQTWTASQRFNTNVLATFGSTDGTDADIYYDGTDLIIDVNSGDLKVVLAGGDLAFQQATTISTSTGILTLDPASTLTLWAAVGANSQGINSRNDSSPGVTLEARSNTLFQNIRFGRSRSGAGNLQAGDVVGGILGTGRMNSGWQNAGSIRLVYIGNGTTRQSAIIFNTENTGDGERWRIDNVGVLTSAGASPSNVSAAGVVFAGGGIAFSDVANAWIDDATHGDGTTTHYIGNNTIDVTAPSDMRVKEEWRPAKEVSSLLRSIPLNEEYRYDPQYVDDQRFHLGPSAQDMQKVWPMMVDDHDSDHLTIQWNHTIPTLMKGWQEHEARVNELRNEVALLRSLVEG